MAERSLMYEPDDDLSLPPGKTRIWRFMGLPDLLYILQKKELFFQAAKRMSDPFDANLPDYLYQRFRFSETVGLPPDDPRPGVLRAKQARQAIRECTCIN